jgi:uncharacterized protein YacL
MLGQASPSPSADPIAGVSGGDAVWLIVGVAGGLALLWAIPLYLDARRSYKALKYLQIPLLEKMLAASEEGKLKLTSEQMGQLVSAVAQSVEEKDRFEATTGLARALMAFAVISILSVALLAVLVSDAADAPDLRKTIITALVSILGTIVGFYFGARTAEMSRASAARDTSEEREKRQEEREQRQDRESPGKHEKQEAGEGSGRHEKPE